MFNDENFMVLSFLKGFEGFCIVVFVYVLKFGDKCN